MRGEEVVLGELRELVFMLERSGLPERRADAAALLAASRARLEGLPGAPTRPRPRATPRRPLRPRPRTRIASKLGLLVVDAAAVACAMFGLVGLAAGTAAPEHAAAAMLAAMFIALLRSRAARQAAAEAGFHLQYHLRWAWLWLAEAFSDQAAARLDALLHGREVMWGWRQHRRGLLHRPTMADVQDFLASAYAQAAAQRFREMLGAATGATGQRHAAARPRQPSVRAPFLLPRFEALALSGALWEEPDGEPAAPRPDLPPLPPATVVAGPSEADQQRAVDIRDLIRRKRDEINTAHGWRLKTPAEIAQRDAHLATLRADIRGLEAELKSMGL